MSGSKNVELQPHLLVNFKSVTQFQKEGEDRYCSQVSLNITNEAGFTIVPQYFTDLKATVTVVSETSHYSSSCATIHPKQPLFLKVSINTNGPRTSGEQTVQLKASIEASTIRSPELVGIKPMFYPVWTVPFDPVSEDVNLELFERHIDLPSKSFISIIEDRQLLEQGLTGAMVRGQLKLKVNENVQVWNSSRLMLQFMAFEHKNSDLFMTNKSVLDLSTGTGLCGLYAACLGSKTVVLTDLPELTTLIEANYEKNKAILNGATVKVEAKLWKSTGETRHFDVVLVSDLTYQENDSFSMIDTLVDCTQPGSIILMVHRLRDAPWEQAMYNYLDQAFSTEEVTQISDSVAFRTKLLRCRRKPTTS